METTMKTTGIKRGDILVAKWGYGMILNTFYKVIKRTPKTVTLVELEETNVDGDGWRGNCVPNIHKVAMHVGNTLPNFITRKVHENGDWSFISVDESRSAYKWDGKPCYYDHWD